MTTKRVVWTYRDVDPSKLTVIPAGPNSKFLAAAMQMGPVIWVEHEVDEHGPVLDREWQVLLVPTGKEFEGDWNYAGLLQAGALVMTEEGPKPRFAVWQVYYRNASDGEFDIHWLESELANETDSEPVAEPDA